MLRSEKFAGALALLVGLTAPLAACGTQTQSGSSAERTRERTSAAAAPSTTPDPAPGPPSAAPSASQPSPEPTLGGVPGARDNSQAGVARAVRICRTVVGDGFLESAFLTTVGHVRSGPIERSGQGSWPALWPGAPDSSPAALCSVRIGTIFTVTAVGPRHEVVPLMKASQPMNPDPGGVQLN